jgi:hypothetical protein
MQAHRLIPTIKINHKIYYIYIDSLCLQVAQAPKSRDMAILGPQTTDKPVALPPAAHARTRGNYDSVVKSF